ncbi:MAG: hypothetical protein A4S09_04870 [Proteobacteria bacterium SG_bin7]|nr:MAG: hypothetical protein A4S09_04870 [Proteobacteria bacterium SG_bin7]
MAQSKYMKAVLTIATASLHTKKLMLTHIDVENESINWEPIFSDPAITSGTRALVMWAYSLWTNEIRINPFDSVHSLDDSHRRKLLEAISVWLEVPVSIHGQSVHNSSATCNQSQDKSVKNRTSLKE